MYFIREITKEDVALINVWRNDPELASHLGAPFAYISQETGFSDCSHMIKTFRKYKNITPKQFRMQNTKTLH